MKLSDFILLNENAKMKTVLNDGILIAKRKYNNKIVFLFQLNRFYAEVYCDYENKARKEYRAFESTNELSPYLQNISIDELIN